jgi:orotate phosphoribosyltransferase-like protein
MLNLTELQKHLIRQRLGEGITIRAIANELNVSKNTVLWHFCLMSSYHTIVKLFVSKPELNGANLPNLDKMYLQCNLKKQS